jgi:protein-disulfide isomerase
MGVRGTPTVVVNGRRFSGSAPAAFLDSLVRLALEEAKSR